MSEREDVPMDAGTRARAAKDALAAQKAQIELQKLRGELVDRKAAQSHVRVLAGKFRAEMETLPAEAGGRLAEWFGLDRQEVVGMLEEEVTGRLERLAGVRVDIPE